MRALLLALAACGGVADLPPAPDAAPLALHLPAPPHDPCAPDPGGVCIGSLTHARRGDCTALASQSLCAAVDAGAWCCDE